MRICWNITNKCNKNCKFCFREKNLESLSLKENLNILDNLIKLDVSKITYAGGEPFLYNNIEKLFEKSHKNDIYVKVSSNGSLLNADNIKEKLHYVDKIAFSLDSCSDEENYFLGRGTNQYAHLKEIIPIIKEIYPKIKIEINTVLTSQTINGLDDLYEELLRTFQEGTIFRWKLLRFCPIRDMSNEKKHLFQISDEDYERIENNYSKRKNFFKIDTIDIPIMERKTVVNPDGTMEYFKNGTKKIIDLKNSVNNSNIIDERKNNENDYSNSNFNLYKVFFDVAQAGSLSLASKKMLISQPAISRSIKKLEEDLGVTLFYRTINGMNLTEKGKELYTYVEDACNSIRIGERSILESTDTYTGKMIVGAPSHIASFYLFDKIKKFHNDYPKVEISIISRPTSDLVKRLENHELDFIIDTAPIDCNEKVLCIEELATSKHCFASLKNHNYNNIINSIYDLEDKPLILPVSKSFHRKKLEELALNCDTKFKNIISIEATEMIKESILQDLGIGYILKDFVKREINDGIIEEIELEEELPSITIDLVYIDKYMTRVPKLFIDNYLKK